jgi:outer membrane lipoprotein-sorting protein
MRSFPGILLVVLSFTILVSAQTAEELVAKNTQAKGGIEKIKAIKTLRSVGSFQQGSFVAQVGQVAKDPDMVRETFTLQGMTQIQAYDGSTGWQISPFQGRKDPEMLGEEDLRNLQEDADFYGPLIDYQQKGNRVEYLGHDSLDGDDVFRLKVTLKNGDILYYYLDPDSFLEIRTEKQQFIRGSMRETVTDLGSYKQVAGVYFPFSIEAGPKGDPSSKAKITIQKMEANVPINDSEFKMPSASAVPSPQKEEFPVPQKKPPKPPASTKPPAKP